MSFSCNEGCKKCIRGSLVNVAKKVSEMVLLYVALCSFQSNRGECEDFLRFPLAVVTCRGQHEPSVNLAVSGMKFKRISFRKNEACNGMKCMF